MKSIIIILFVFVVLVAVFSVTRKVLAGTQENQKDSKELYAGLRNQALGMNLKDLSGVSPVGVHGVYGIIMEMGQPEGTITLVTFLPGDASLYFSNGGGMIGGSGYDQVRKAVVNFNEKANQYILNCQKVTSFPLPVEGQTVFYILTREGIYTYQAKENDLGNERDALSPLFFSGQEVITQFRLASESKDKK